MEFDFKLYEKNNRSDSTKVKKKKNQIQPRHDALYDVKLIKT